MSQAISIDELRRQANQLGYRLEPITQLDLDKELFIHCTTWDEVREVIASLPAGYVIEPSAIPTSSQLQQRREVRDELILRGIEPGKTVSAVLNLRVGHHQGD